MRLIRTETLELEDVSEKLEPYAILSHTWGEDEVTYLQFQNKERRKSQQGFEKIRLTCEQAQSDGLRYAWVDTCCIDKTSSAELSEAINSMFKWYRASAVCYAYLSDVPQGDDPRSSDSDFAKSRWFTRGWTLQELIAPGAVQFYGASWSKLGDKSELIAELESITGINAEILRGEPMKTIPVAKRMTWAARRNTSRQEDIAYCLMGIFDVNMPMLYGEGQKAFIRLQEEILKESEDHSLFAWRATAESAEKAPLRGILASSPDEFLGCDDIVPFRNLSTSYIPTTLTSRGVPLTSTLFFEPEGTDNKALVGLNCRWGNEFRKVIGIELVCQGGDQFVRSSPSKLFPCPSHGRQETVYVTKSLHATEVLLSPELERQYAFYISLLPEGVSVAGVYPSKVPYSPKLGLIRLGPWIEDKAAIELMVPWSTDRLLILLWAVKAKGSRAYEHFYTASITSSRDLQAKFQQTKRPKEVTDEHIIAFGPGKQLVTIAVRPGKVQGFDMFCIEVRLEKDSRSYVPRRIRSMYTATKV